MLAVEAGSHARAVPSACGCIRVILLDALEITPAEAAELPRGSTGRVRVIKTDSVAVSACRAVSARSFG